MLSLKCPIQKVVAEVILIPHFFLPGIMPSLKKNTKKTIESSVFTFEYAKDTYFHVMLPGM